MAASPPNPSELLDTFHVAAREYLDTRDSKAKRPNRESLRFANFVLWCDNLPALLPAVNDFLIVPGKKAKKGNLRARLRVLFDSGKDAVTRDVENAKALQALHRDLYTYAHLGEKKKELKRGRRKTTREQVEDDFKRVGEQHAGHASDITRYLDLYFPKAAEEGASLEQRFSPAFKQAAEDYIATRGFFSWPNEASLRFADFISWCPDFDALVAAVHQFMTVEGKKRKSGNLRYKLGSHYDALIPELPNPTSGRLEALQTLHGQMYAAVVGDIGKSKIKKGKWKKDGLEALRAMYEEEDGDLVRPYACTKYRDPADEPPTPILSTYVSFDSSPIASGASTPEKYATPPGYEGKVEKQDIGKVLEAVVNKLTDDRDLASDPASDPSSKCTIS